MLKNIMRRTLSIVLSIIMLLTLCTAAATSIVAQASVSVAAGDDCPTLYFVVPEVIYLQPVWNSGGDSTTANFQFYVNNELSSNGTLSLKSGEETSGKMYFRYENTSSVSITFTWLNTSGASISGGSIKFGDSTSRAAGKAYTTTPSVSAINITSGTSPSLAANVTGAYLRWTATFTDSADKLVKSISAYTYVYKPYVAPVGVAHRTENSRGTNHFGQSISWISGVHGVNTTGSHYAKTEQNGNGLMTFSSSASNGIQIGELNAQFAAADNASSRWYWQGMDNNGSSGWLTDDASCKMPAKTMRYLDSSRDSPSSGDIAYANFGPSPTAKLIVDTSRYTNFNQIPNLSTGLMLTDDQKSSKAAFYIGDYTGSWMTGDDLDWYRSRSHTKDIWTQYRAGTLFASKGNCDSPETDTEEVKFNGRWNHSISSSAGVASFNCAVAAAYYNDDGSDSIWNIAELRASVTAHNYTKLRNALQNAIHYTGMFQSFFYDTNNTPWVNFSELYRAGYMAMTRVDYAFSATATVNGRTTNYSDPDTLATDLQNAITALKSDTARASLTATQTSVALAPQIDGTYKIVEFQGGNASQSAPYYSYNAVTFSADNVKGYTFKGLVSTAQPDIFTVGNTLDALPTFTTSAANSYSFNAATGKIVYKHVTTSGTGPTSGNLYYSYYYIANEFTVHFDPNGGAGNMTDQPFVYNITQNLRTNAFQRRGYTFLGWAETETGAVKYTDKQPVSNLTDTDKATVTLYAKWSPETYAINFDPNGGALTSVPISSYTIETSVTMPSATKTGYTLTSWRDNGAWGNTTYTPGHSYSGKYGIVAFTANWSANSYSVAFNPNGGSGNMSNQSFSYDTAANLDANQFQRTGYTFRGWAYSNTATNPAYEDKQPVINLTDENGAVITLYALWNPVTYTITYKEEGGLIRDALGSYTTSYTIEDQIQLPVNVERAGYAFGGWLPNTTITDSWNASTAYSGLLAAGKFGSVILSAQWQASSYTITYQYDAPDGSLVGSNYTTSYNINTTVSLPSARKTGYTFGGWLANNVGSWGESVYNSGRLGSGMYGDVTLTAQWQGITYFISFNGNGSSSGTMRDMTMTYGKEVALNTNNFIRTGYNFIGWGNSANATTVAYTDGQPVGNLTTTSNDVITLFAMWSADAYTITYDATGGTITQEGTTSYTITDSVKMPVATRAGYTLTGWTPAATAGNWVALETYTGTQNAGMYGNVTLKAQWSKVSYEITWKPAGGTLSGVYTTSYDIDTVIKLPTVKRAGYAFKEWQADAAWDNVTFTDTAPTGKLGNVTITAVWLERTYTVKFNANGGEGEMADQVIRFDTATPLTDNVFTKLGYKFAGWAYDNEATSADFTDGTTVYNLATNDGDTVDLYAVWTAIDISFAYNLNGADGFLGNTNSKMGRTITLRTMSEEPVTINNLPYTFGGWALSKDDANNGVVAYENGASITIDETLLSTAPFNWSGSRPVLTLYAIWNNVAIELKLVENSGSVLDEEKGILYGFEAELTPEDMAAYLGVEGNGHLEYVCNGYIGTGTTVKLINDATGQSEAEYTIVIFGDLNGDGQINQFDKSILKSMNTGATPVTDDDFFCYAADINNDGDVNQFDMTIFKGMIAGSVHLNQSTRETELPA